jgi:integrase
LHCASSKRTGNCARDAPRKTSDHLTRSARSKTHGLGKAAARRLAEAGCTSKQIQAITGHKTLAEVERYTRKADQVWLARKAMKKQQKADGEFATSPLLRKTQLLQ